MTPVIEPHRPRILFILLSMLAIAILGRALYLQYFIADVNLEKAGWKTESEVALNAPRGAIWDRYGVPLAESIEAYHVDIDPRLFYSQRRGEEQAIVELFKPFKTFDAQKFLAYADQPLNDVPKFMRVSRGVSPRDAERIKQQAAHIGTSAIILNTSYERYYPLKGVAGSLIGFVDREGKQGRAGLESGLDEMLRGGSLTYRVVRDVRRDPYLLGELPDVDAIRGRTIELTLDARLQQFTEKTLEEAVETFRAQEAMAVVSNVKTGELLAVASVPTVDPARPFDSPEEYVWSPHALSYAIEPGSTAKVLTYAFAIDAGALTPDTLIDCEGGAIKIDGHTIRDTHPEDIITAQKALEVSSNVGSWKMASKLGAEKHRQYLEKAGIGTRPDIPVSGASRGILPPLKWIDLQHANISFGHGFSASIVQLHSAISAIANHGVRLKPHLVRAYHYGDGSVENIAPEPIERVVSERTAKLTLQAMHEAVYGEDGTGHAAKIPGVEIAGKTGTARLVDLDKGGYLHEYLGSFSGVFPAHDPQYAITVWILRPDKSLGYYGAKTAAPLFRTIGEEVLRLYAGNPATWAKDVDTAIATLSPSKEKDSEAAQALQSTTEDDDTIASPRAVPELVGKRAIEAVSILRERQMPVQIHGSGRVAVQQPAAGEPLEKGMHVVLQLSPEDIE